MKTMRTFASVTACVFATVQALDTTPGWCVLDGTSSVNDLMDAGVYSWAASQRCTPQSIQADGPIKCEMDVASAAQSITRMISVILRSVKTCGLVSTDECGMAATKLISHLEGIAAAAGGIVQECPNPLQKQHPNWVMRDSLRQVNGGMSMADPRWPQGEHAVCVVDIKDTVNELFQATININRAKKGCDKAEHTCVYDAFSIIAAFAGMSKYVMGAVGHCSSGALPVQDFPLTCTEHISGLVRSVSGFVGDADELQAACSNRVPGPVPGYVDSGNRKTEVFVIPHAKPSSRLYQETDKVTTEEGSKLNMALVAFMPIVALASFVVGARQRQQYTSIGSREIELGDAE